MKGVVLSGKLQFSQLLFTWTLFHPWETPKTPEKLNLKITKCSSSFCVCNSLQQHFLKCSFWVTWKIAAKWVRASEPRGGGKPRTLHLCQVSQVILLSPELGEPLGSRVPFSKSIFVHYKNNTYTFKTLANNREGNICYFYYPNLKLWGFGSFLFNPFPPDIFFFF